MANKNDELAKVEPRQTSMLEAAGYVYDFDLNDFGNQPPYTKEEMDGKVIIVYGVSNARLEGGNYNVPARGLLHKLPDEDADTEPYGLLFAETSPVIAQTLRMQELGRVPFQARLVSKASQEHRGQTYWTLEKAPPLRYDSDGTLIDPNA